MAFVDLYCNSVTGAAWTTPENAQGAPSSANDAPYATDAIAAAGNSALTGSFAAYTIPGTITEVNCLFTCRSTVASPDTVMVPAISGITVNDDVFAPITNFATAPAQADVADPEAFKASIAAGLTGYTLTAFTTAGATVDVKGMGLRVYYTPTAMDPAFGSPGLGRSRGRNFRGR